MNRPGASKAGRAGMGRADRESTGLAGGGPAHGNRFVRPEGVRPESPSSPGGPLPLAAVRVPGLWWRPLMIWIRPLR